MPAKNITMVFTGQTTDATPTQLGAYTPPDDHAVQVTLRGAFVRPSSPAAGSGVRSYTFGKTGGAVSLVGSVYSDGGAIDAAISAATLDADASGGNIRVMVTGIAATTIQWTVTVEVTLVPFS